jgi:hypothetical protein
MSSAASHSGMSNACSGSQSPVLSGGGSGLGFRRPMGCGHLPSQAVAGRKFLEQLSLVLSVAMLLPRGTQVEWT